MAITQIKKTDFIQDYLHVKCQLLACLCYLVLLTDDFQQEIKNIDSIYIVNCITEIILFADFCPK